jgi:hypothetical protein
VTRPSDQLLAWAAVGSRISGFHHDSASKLQSMMMALDEAQDLLGDSSSEVHRSIEVAMGALRELHGLLTENRALAKPPVRRDVALADLLALASQRFGVALRGEVPAARVFVGLASFGHALALLCDVIAGPVQGARVIDIEVRDVNGLVAVTLTGQAPMRTAPDAILLATWLVEREGGEVFSAPNGFRIHIPMSLTSSSPSP